MCIHYQHPLPLPLTHPPAPPRMRCEDYSSSESTLCENVDLIMELPETTHKCAWSHTHIKTHSKHTQTHTTKHHRQGSNDPHNARERPVNPKAEIRMFSPKNVFLTAWKKTEMGRENVFNEPALSVVSLTQTPNLVGFPGARCRAAQTRPDFNVYLYVLSSGSLIWIHLLHFHPHRSVSFVCVCVCVRGDRQAFATNKIYF